MNKRIEYLDIAKGIGILFVVLGHNHIKTEYPAVYQVVYSFHMPFFFLLSGMFFKPQYGFAELARRRFRSLLKPFLAYMVVVYAASIFFTKIDLPTIFSRIAKALYAGPSTLEWVPLWFLPHLFLVNLVAFVLIKFVYGRIPFLWLRILLLAGMLWLGAATLATFLDFKFSILNHPFAFYGLPWSADLLLITTAFFLLGYELRRTLFDRDIWSRHYGWILLGATVVFVGLNLFFHTTIDFYIRSYGDYPIVSTLEALSGSLMILGLAKWLEKSPAQANPIKFLGSASIVLLIFHYVPQEFLYAKLIDLHLGVLLSCLISYAAGVLVPVLLFAWVIRPNQWLAAWFGIVPTEKMV